MKLTLKNIGKVGKASVEINGITVIAGENNTGKSTVGRALFSVFNSFCNVQSQIKYERIKSIENLLDRLYMDHNSTFMIDTRSMAKSIVERLDTCQQEDLQSKKREIMDFLLQREDLKSASMNDNVLAETSKRIIDILNVSSMEYLKSLLQKKLNAEFNGQVCNIYSDDDGEIQLRIKDSSITVMVNSEGTKEIKNPNSISLCTEVVYIDDPFVLDEMNPFLWGRPINYADHRDHLRMKLVLSDKETNVLDEIIAQDKLNSIYEKLSSVCNGDIIRGKRSELGYQKKGSDKVLNVRNISTGLKTFVILKMLLMSGAIEHNGTIVLDEPEIHLHPEWQLLFAELIVLIQIEFGVHVLLNTHSPYFLNAIEVYTAKYGISDKCKYYLASSQNEISYIDDVTDNIEAIYKKLARPLQFLENERSQI